MTHQNGIDGYQAISERPQPPWTKLIGRVWRGEYSLAKQYWLCLWLPSTVLNLLWIGLAFVTFQTGTLVRDFVEASIGIAAVLVVVVGFVGVVRCVFRRRQWGWGTIAILWLTVQIVVMVSRAFDPSIEGADDNLAMEIMGMNAQLPQTIDDATVIKRADYDRAHRMITFTYQIDWTRVKLRAGDIKQAYLPDACVALGDRWGGVKKIRWYIEDKTRARADEIVDIVPSDCKG